MLHKLLRCHKTVIFAKHKKQYWMQHMLRVLLNRLVSIKTKHTNLRHVGFSGPTRARSGAEEKCFASRPPGNGRRTKNLHTLKGSLSDAHRPCLGLKDFIYTIHKWHYRERQKNKLDHSWATGPIRGRWDLVICTGFQPTPLPLVSIGGTYSSVEGSNPLHNVDTSWHSKFSLEDMNRQNCFALKIKCDTLQNNLTAVTKWDLRSSWWIRFVL
jgi:hypothetical protein